MTNEQARRAAIQFLHEIVKDAGPTPAINREHARLLLNLHAHRYLALAS